MTTALHRLGFRVLTQTTNGILRHGHHRGLNRGIDARDRVQLVIIAYDAGLVAPAR
jgi:hypothetical protein